MKDWMMLYKEALDRFMPTICGRKIVALTLFAFVFLGAQTDIGVRSSGGVHPLVVATIIYVPFMVYANLCNAKSSVMSLERSLRDAVLATVACFSGVAVAILILTNSEMIAMRFFSVSSLAYAAVYFYGYFNRQFLTDYIRWPWRTLSIGVRRAGVIMAFTYLLSAILSEVLIAHGSVGAWAFMRLAWPVVGLRLGHALIVADQVNLRRRGVTSATV